MPYGPKKAQNFKAIEKKKPSDFFGTLSKEEGEKFHTYITKAREEWGRNI